VRADVPTSQDTRPRGVEKVPTIRYVGFTFEKVSDANLRMINVNSGNWHVVCVAFSGDVTKSRGNIKS
jgi:hypothetical protein